jgi:hypothetical protein
LLRPDRKTLPPPLPPPFSDERKRFPTRIPHGSGMPEMDLSPRHADYDAVCGDYERPFKWIGAACCLLIAVYAIGALAPVASGWEFVPGPPKVEPAPWHPLLEAPRNSRTHVLGLSISTGYCAGEPPPRVDHVKVIERAKTAKNPSKSVVITAYVRFPAPMEVEGEVKPGEPQPGCAGIGVGIFKRIKLKRPIEGMLLFDGSFSPPRRVRP